MVYLFIVRAGLALSGPQWAWLLNRHCCNVEVFHFLYLRDPEVDKFQNLISSSLSTDTSVVKCS